MKRIYFGLVFIFVSIALLGQSLGELAGAVSETKNIGQKEVVAMPKQNQSSTKKVSGEVSQEEFDSIFLRASQGDANAQLALGVLYARGVKPVSPNAELALQWLEKSAKQGNVAAMNYMGVIYGDGKLIKRDIQKAIYWRELAAEKGTAADKFALANSFIYGYMLPANQQKALYWLTKSGEAGHIDAINQLVSIYSNRGDKQQATYWKHQRSYAQIKAAQAGDVSAMYEVYRKYISGKGGLYKSVPKGIFWLEKAANAEHIQAMDTLAMMYINGRYVERDFKKGISILERIAEKNPSYAMKISTIYSEDLDNRDLQKAQQWLDIAAKNLGGINKIHLIWKLWAGAGVEKNLKKASAYCNEMITSPTEVNVKDFVAKMKRDIDSAKQAPKTFSELCNQPLR